MRAATDFSGRVAAVESWLRALMDDAEPDGAIDRVSLLLVAEHGHRRVDELVKRSGLSASRLQRRFALRVGTTPKLFARTVRFDAALVARRNAPGRTWTDIVHELGYFDQAHSSANAAPSRGQARQRTPHAANLKERDQWPRQE